MKFLNNQIIVFVIGLLFVSSASLHAISCEEKEIEYSHSNCQFLENDVSDTIKINSFVTQFSIFGLVVIEKKKTLTSEYFSNFHSRAPPINKV